MSYSTVACEECQQNFKKLEKEIKRSKTNRHFCSRSCAAKYNNRIAPKRQPQGKCEICNYQINAHRRFCDKCLPKYHESLRTGNRCEDCNTKCSGNRCRACHKKHRTDHANFTKRISKNKNQYYYNNCSECNAPCTGKNYCQKCYDKNRIDDPTLKEATYTRHHKSSAFALVRSRARAIAKNLGWNSCSICGYDKHIEIDHIKPISEFDESTKMSVINDPSNLRPLCPNCHWEIENLY